MAISSYEAEFMAATTAACQRIWLWNLLMQIIDIEPCPVAIYVDNKSAIELTKNPVFHHRSKHIEIRYHIIMDYIERGDIMVKHVCTNEQRMLRKAMSNVKFKERFGLKSIN